MKVCMLTTSFPRFSGDYAGNFVCELAKKLVSAGVQVVVVAPHESGAPKREMMDGITVERFAYMFPNKWQRIAYLGGIPDNLRRYWLAWAQLPVFLLAFFFKALGVCRSCDIIHAHWVFSGLIALMTTAVRRKPVVLTVQGSDLNLLPQNAFFRLIRARVLGRVHKIITVSSALAEMVRDLDPAPGKVNVIPNGVELAAFPYRLPPATMDYRLLWMGRINPEKGIEYLIEAMPHVLEHFPQATLTLIGDGPLKKDIEQKVKNAGMCGRVCFAGRVPYQEIPAHLGQADLFVLPSLKEGLPLVLLEAMSMGKPVIASRVGGIPEVLVDSGEGQTGYLVPAGDSKALSKAIVAALENPEKSTEMGRNGRRCVESNYTWSIVASQTLDLYRSLS